MTTLALKGLEFPDQAYLNNIVNRIIEALRNRGIRFEEISIQYSSRHGDAKLNPWRDGLHNIWFLIRKRFRAG